MVPPPDVVVRPAADYLVLWNSEDLKREQLGDRTANCRLRRLSARRAVRLTGGRERRDVVRTKVDAILIRHTQFTWQEILDLP